VLFEIPDYWTPEQALAVYELLDEKWLHNFRQDDEWNLCLTAGTVVPANQERR